MLPTQFVDGIEVMDGWLWFEQFFLPILVCPFLIAIGYFYRWGFGQLPPRSEVIGYVIVFLVYAVMFKDADFSSGDPAEMLFSVIVVGLPILSMALAAWLRIARQRTDLGLFGIQGIYLTHLVMYLFFIDGEPALGWWLAVTAVVSGTIQIALLLKRPFYVLVYGLAIAGFGVLGLLDAL